MRSYGVSSILEPNSGASLLTVSFMTMGSSCLAVMMVLLPFLLTATAMTLPAIGAVGLNL